MIALFRIPWFVLTICAMLGFPRQFWTELDPLRWVVIGAMLGDFFWAVPRFLTDFRKSREAAQ
jgi:hypothetical protein